MNDGNFNPKKIGWLAKLGRVFSGVGAMLYWPSTVGPETWTVDGVEITRNDDTGNLFITHEDGTQEFYKIDHEGVVYDAETYDPVGSFGDKNNFVPISEQDDAAYRTWKANGGEGGYHDWKSIGKPSGLEGTGVAHSKVPLQRDLSGGPHAPGLELEDAIIQSGTRSANNPEKVGPREGLPRGEGRWLSEDAVLRAVDKVDPARGRQIVPIENGDGIVIYGGVSGHEGSQPVRQSDSRVEVIAGQEVSIPGSILVVPSDRALAIPRPDGQVHIFPIDENHVLYNNKDIFNGM